nr:uncharacterized protein CTRU02_15443 [Colletotrichum truncatum]KAF6781042.1 hypothetical protein CTRU02_15443 [Colletotrichum truncatum]
MEERISNIVRGILRGFGQLLESARRSEDEALQSSLPLKLEDELARFKIWTRNHGAHRMGRNSLEHRLQDASHIHQLVSTLLGDLKGSLDEATSILTGDKTPWDQLEVDEESLNDLETETEIAQIALDITELVDCLLRLSVPIKSPAPHDQLMAADLTDTSAFEEVDIQHVKAKFPIIEEYLAQRLGRAISRRRQYLKYREARHLGRSHGVGLHGDTKRREVEPSTIDSSTTLHVNQEPSFGSSDDDTQSDEEASQASNSVSPTSSETLDIPSMPDEGANGPFQCPFCYCSIIIPSSETWKKHVLSDLRPYTCLAEKCLAPEHEFSRKKEWMQHMLQNHLRIYRCPYGCASNFHSQTESKAHLMETHEVTVPERSAEDLVELSSHPLPSDVQTKCPLCPKDLTSLEEYQHHVGNHQQELALFVLSHKELTYAGKRENEVATSHDTDYAASAEYVEPTPELPDIREMDYDEKRSKRRAKTQFISTLIELAISQDYHVDINPRIDDDPIDLFALFQAVQREGGYWWVNTRRKWTLVSTEIGLDPKIMPHAPRAVKEVYEKCLYRFEKSLKEKDRSELVVGGVFKRIPNPWEDEGPSDTRSSTERADRHIEISEGAPETRDAAIPETLDDDNKLLCSYDECKRSIPSSVFSTEESFKDHMRLIHNDIYDAKYNPVEDIDTVARPETQVSKPRDSLEETKNTECHSSEYFICKDGINGQVIEANIHRYLGGDALVRPAYYFDPQTSQDVNGYSITSTHKVTAVGFTLL